MWLVSAVSLAVVMFLCVCGVFAPKAYYDDNLAQRLGMSGVFMFSWPRLMQLIELRDITANTMPVSAQIAGHVGLALFAVGTAYKAYLRRPRIDPPVTHEHHPMRRHTDEHGVPQ